MVAFRFMYTVHVSNVANIVICLRVFSCVWSAKTWIPPIWASWLTTPLHWAVFKFLLESLVYIWVSSKIESVSHTHRTTNDKSFWMLMIVFLYREFVQIAVLWSGFVLKFRCKESSLKNWGLKFRRILCLLSRVVGLQCHILEDWGIGEVIGYFEDLSLKAP